MTPRIKAIICAMITAALLCSCSIAMANLTDAGMSEDNFAMGDEYEEGNFTDSKTIFEEKGNVNVSHDSFRQGDEELYWTFERNRIKLARKVAEEMSLAGWENVKAYDYMPEEKDRKFAIWVTEEEAGRYSAFVEGSINGFGDTPIYVFSILGFTAEKPEGEIMRVYYATESGRSWEPRYDKNKIWSAYTPELWASMYGY